LRWNLFNVESKDVLHVSGQLVDNGEVAEHAGAVSDDDGPHRQGSQHLTPGHTWGLQYF